MVNRVFMPTQTTPKDIEGAIGSERFPFILGFGGQMWIPKMILSCPKSALYLFGQQKNRKKIRNGDVRKIFVPLPSTFISSLADPVFDHFRAKVNGNQRDSANSTTVLRRRVQAIS
jgi:hypothetical protein